MASPTVRRGGPLGPPERVRRIALTGGIATGKSYVRGRFEARGVPTIDADVLAREAVAPGTPGLTALVRRFGSEVLDPHGALDRQKMAAIVFADPDARHALEAIVHPQVRRAMEHWFASLDASRHPLAIADIPLLYEVGRDRDFDTVIVAACDPDTQVRRIMARDGLAESETRQRLAAQLPIDEKARRADYVIRTDGSFEETDAQVKDVLDRLLAMGRVAPPTTRLP
ncbi:MAG: dephospho-CoA kinase [Acidobacteria bacterium]|nr:dephospho-CoA kinase [Acidobacteriota bacterium]